MDDKKQQTTFGDLPQALVKELLDKSQGVGAALFKSFSKIQKDKQKLRVGLEKSNRLAKESDFSITSPPTTCGVDGSYAKEELLSVDLLAAAAVAIEGLTPPSETRYWEEPHHKVYIKEEEHNPETATILRGWMIGMEQILAADVPHDVVFLDGSFTTPLIFFNQAINVIKVAKGNQNLAISKAFLQILPDALAAYEKNVSSTRTDKLWLGLPKYTSKKELGGDLNWNPVYDDRAILTLILSPGELTKPIDLDQPSEPWHLEFGQAKDKIEVIKKCLGSLKVMYYKPHEWTPAIRIELTASASANKYQIGMIVQALKFQCSTPGIFEPFPLYMADRMVKSLGTGLPTFRQVVTKQMAEEYEGDIGEVFFGMHGYRTERHK